MGRPPVEVRNQRPLRNALRALGIKRIVGELGPNVPQRFVDELEARGAIIEDIEGKRVVTELL